MRWLVATYRFPFPLTHGSWLRTYHLLRSLVQLGDAVGLVAYPAPADARAVYEDAGIELLDGPAHDPPRQGRGRCRLSPHAHDAALSAAVAQHAPSADAVLLVREPALQYAPDARRAPRVLVDMVDDPAVERASFGDGRSGDASWIHALRLRMGEKRYERTYAHAVDAFAFTTDVDAGAFAKRHPAARCEVVPNGVDVERFRPMDAVGGPSDARTVVFVGNLAHRPNADAAQWLLQEIAPRVWRTHPDARFRIVGPNPPADLLALRSERVDVTGEVADVREHVAPAAVVSCPMRSGTGIKNKLLEAWAMGRAVVATRRATQAIPAIDDENLLLGEAPAAHAAAIVRLLDDADLRDRLGAAGRKVVEERFTWRIAAQRLRTLAATHPPGGSGIEAFQRISGDERR